jgi:hypothetical protein
MILMSALSKSHMRLQPHELGTASITRGGGHMVKDPSKLSL